MRKLPAPFMVIATQNAIEQQGTYPLPEAQLDRFFMKLNLDYPSRHEWERILDQSEEADPLMNLKRVASLEEIERLKDKIEKVTVSKEIKTYIIDLAQMISQHELVQTGVSPRGTIALLKASKARALFKGRSYVLPDDVQAMLIPVLGHRIMLTGHAEWKSMKHEKLIQSVLEAVAVPVIE